MNTGLEEILDAFDEVLRALQERGRHGQDIARDAEQWRDAVVRSEDGALAASHAVTFLKVTSSGAGWLLEEDEQLRDLLARANRLVFAWRKSAYADMELVQYRQAYPVPDDRILRRQSRG